MGRPLMMSQSKGREGIKDFVKTVLWPSNKKFNDGGSDVKNSKKLRDFNYGQPLSENSPEVSFVD